MAVLRNNLGDSDGVWVRLQKFWIPDSGFDRLKRTPFMRKSDQNQNRYWDSGA